MTSHCPSITSFRGDYSFLSNFYIEPDGTHVEGEYQAAKAIYPEDARRLKSMTPSRAKFMGQLVELRPDWEEVKIGIMLDLVVAKFADHPTLAEKLILTFPCVLVEGNQWGDTFWGVCRGHGTNYLGHILMEVRDALVKALRHTEAERG